MNVKLHESTVSLGEIKGKRRWYSRLIAVGSGSSGFHSAEALKNTGPAAWPAGTKINIDHQSFSEYLEKPAGSLQTLAGIVASTPEFRDDVETPGLYAEVEFGEQWGPFVEQFAEFIGLSITADYYGEDKTEEGQTIVEGYIPSVLNTVDLVTAPGAKGRLLQAIESFDGNSPLKVSDNGKLIIETATEAETKNRKDKGMEPEDIEKVAEKLAEALAPHFATLKEALAPAQKPEGEETKAPETAEVAEALVAAGLPESARKRVYEALKVEGADVKTAIEAEKKYIEDVLKESEKAEESAGRTRTVEDAKPEGRVRVPGWSN